MGNGWDPYLLDAAFTLNFEGVAWTASGTYAPANYPYISTIANSYEGCLITLSWYKQYTGSTITNVQLLRTTYTIKTHTNYVNSIATEFQTVKHYSYTATAADNTAASAYWPACLATTKYYWNPFLAHYFFLDDITSETKMVFTCFPYTTAPTSACSSDFNAAGTPTFKVATLTTHPCSASSVCSVLNKVVFTRNTMYVALSYKTAASQFQQSLRKVTVAGTSCANYVPTLAATGVFDTAAEASDNKITDMGVIA